MGRTARIAAGAGVVGAAAAALGWKASKERSHSSAEVDVAVPAPLVFKDVDPERFVTALSTAITFETVVRQDQTYDAVEFDAQAAMFAERYPLTHATLERETFADHALLYTWRGSDELLDPVVLMGHQDVVPVEPGTEEDWIKPAFEGAVIGGKVYGRGALDCKGPLIAVFEAIEYLLERGAVPERTVHLVSGHDEEVGGEGADAITTELAARGITPWFVIDEGGAIAEGVLPGVDAPIALVGIAEKGCMTLQLTSRGEGGHSSMPPRGTAIARLAEVIVDLEANPVPARISAVAPMLDALAEHLPGAMGTLASNRLARTTLLSRAFAKEPLLDALQRTTMVPTIVEAGVKSNVVPQHATVIVNTRIIPGDTQDSVVDHIRNVVGDDIEIEVLPESLKDPSRFSSIDSDAWEVLTGVIAEVFPTAIVAPWVFTGATDSRFFEPTAGDVYRFSPFVLDGDAMGGFHGTNEHVRQQDAAAAVSFFVRLIAVTARTGGLS